MRKLNVGCGLDPWGDVRMDLNLTFPYAQGSRRSTLNVRASATHLPFREGIFDEVRAWHVLEHMPEPPRVVRELRRVCSGTISIRVPTSSLWAMLTETAHTLVVLFAIFRGRSKPREFVDCLRQIQAWPKRWRDHLWLIRPKGAHLHFYGWVLPYELEFTLSGNQAYEFPDSGE